MLGTSKYVITSLRTDGWRSLRHLLKRNAIPAANLRPTLKAIVASSSRMMLPMAQTFLFSIWHKTWML